jgi:hypothetical protein
LILFDLILDSCICCYFDSIIDSSTKTRLDLTRLLYGCLLSFCYYCTVWLMMMREGVFWRFNTPTTVCCWGLRRILALHCLLCNMLFASSCVLKKKKRDTAMCIYCKLALLPFFFAFCKCIAVFFLSIFMIFWMVRTTKQRMRGKYDEERSTDIIVHFVILVLVRLN